jgi:hypothetical protein
MTRALGAVAVLLCCAGCLPNIRLPDTKDDFRTVTPILQAIPLRESYAVGDPFNPAADIAVYRQGEDGGIQQLSFAAGEFSVTLTLSGGSPVTLSTGEHILNTPGSYTVVVSAGALNAPLYTVTADSGGGSIAWQREVLVVPFKNSYNNGEHIDPANDLTVYTRNTSTGAMEKRTATLPSPEFTVSPDTITTPIPADAPIPITVTVNSYAVNPAPIYNVWVGPAPSSGGSVTPALLAVPLRNTYSVGGFIDPVSDLLVYKSDSSGVYTPLTHGTGYGLAYTPAGSSITVDPSGTAFISADVLASPITITVTETSGSLFYIYAVNVIPAGAEVLSVVYSDGLPGPNMKRNAQGAYVLDGPPQGKMIHTVQPLAGNTPIPGKEYLVGRMDHEAVTMNIDPLSGDLSFRTPYSAGPYSGLIPVESVEEMLRVKASVGGNYVLAADLDMLGFSSHNPQTWSGYPFYSGVFDGGGRVIRGFKGNTGLFIQVGQSGNTTEIRNVIVEGEITKTGSGSETGGITTVVYQSSGGTTVLRNCENRANVSSGGNSDTGGVAGKVNGGTLINCRNTGEVTTSGNNIGGVAGLVESGGTLTGCSNSGPVSGSGKFTGGVAGFVDTNSKLINCFNQAQAVVTSSYLNTGNPGENYGYTGGVAGAVRGATLSSCGSYGAVYSKSGNTGGVAGQLELSAAAAITGCSNSGSVTSQGDYNGSTIYNAHNTGGIAGQITLASGTVADVSVTNCTNSGEVNSKTFGPSVSHRSNNSGGVAGLVTIPTTVTGSLRLLNCANTGPVNNGADSLILSSSGGVAGRVENRAVLYSCSNMAGVRGFSQTGGIAGTVSSGAKLTACVNSGPVTGTEKSESIGGVAGYVDGDGTLLSGCSNAGTVTSGPSPGNSGTGGVVGKVNGSNSSIVVVDIILNCSNSGTVTGKDSTGGVVGIADYIGNIANCVNQGEVNGTEDRAGGVAGSVSLSMNITGCTNRGTVRQTGSGNNTGGVAGYVGDDGKLIDCSNMGTVTQTGTGIYTGGIAGFAKGGTSGKAFLTNCSNQATGRVSSPNTDTGGVVGKVVDGELNNCSNAAPVRGDGGLAGGVAGFVESSKLTDCVNRGEVKTDGTGEKIGGIIGAFSDTSLGAKLIGCTNFGAVVITSSSTNIAYAAGLVGGEVKDSNLVILRCSNRGPVTSTVTAGSAKAGGLVALIKGGYLIACYNTGAVSSTAQGDADTGGVAGDAVLSNSNRIIACYNTGSITSTATTGNARAGGLVGIGFITIDGMAACYNTGAVSSSGPPGQAVAGGVMGREYALPSILSACYWDDSTAASGIGSGSAVSTSFPGVFDPPSDSQWGTGSGWDGITPSTPPLSGNGVWWKAGTTSGTMLPRLWWE